MVLSKLAACFKEDANKKQYYIAYTVLFLICVFFCFSWFFLSGRSLIWFPDGWHQHFRALVYYAQYLRSIVRSLLVDHKLVIPNWDFCIGEGSDVLRTMHYYVMGDPITLLSVFVPTVLMNHFYSASCILRLYLAGIAFSQLCFGTGLKNRHGILAGALSYVFCMWGIYNAARHPYFLNPMIYFPLLILGMEKIIRKENAVLFILIVTVSAVSNFYFFYVIVILAIIYALIRVFGIYGKNVKEGFLTIIRIGIYALIGVALAGFLFLPVLMAFLEDSRLSLSQPFYLFYPLYYYSQLPGIAVSNKVSYWFVLGLTAPALLSVFLLFSERKKNGLLKTLFLACVVITLFPIFGRILNGMSYMTNRWVWAFVLLCTYILAVQWEDLLSVTKRRWLFLAISAFVFYIACLHFDKSRSEAVFSATTLLFVALMILREKTDNETYPADIRSLLLIGIVILCVVNTALWQFSPAADNYVSEFEENDKLWIEWSNNETTVIKEISDSSYTRYSGRKINVNAGVSERLSNTGYYWTISNPYVNDYRSNLQMAEQSIHDYTGYDDRTALLALASVQYFTVPKENEEPKGLPYGYELIDTFDANVSLASQIKKLEKELSVDKLTNGQSSKIENAISNKYLVYKNDYTLPLGYCYDAQISLDQWEALNPVQKQESLLSAAVTETKQGKLPEYSDFSEDYLVPFQVQCVGKEISKSGSDYICTANNTKITVTFDELLQNGEIYIGFEGLDFTATMEYDLYFGDESVDPLNLYNRTNWDLLAKDRQISIKRSKDYQNPISKLILTIDASNGVEKTLTYLQPGAPFSSGRHDFIVNLGYTTEEVNSVTITLPSRGIYHLDDLKVYRVSMEGYEEKIGQLQKDTLKEIRLDTDAIYGKLDIDSEKILCIATPYSEGWTGSIDGTEAEVFCVNDHYLGMLVPAGSHEISLHYRTPYRTAGLLLSLAGAAGLLAVWILERKKRDHK